MNLQVVKHMLLSSAVFDASNDGWSSLGLVHCGSTVCMFTEREQLRVFRASRVCCGSRVEGLLEFRILDANYAV